MPTAKRTARRHRSSRAVGGHLSAAENSFSRAPLPPPPPPPRGRPAPEPSEHAAVYPWKYKLGQWVYVLNDDKERQYKIVGGQLAGVAGWPHYELENWENRIHLRVAQTQVSSRPPSFRHG